MTPTPPETPAQRISRDLAAAARARNRGDWRRAIRDLDTALAINPQLPRARSALVRLELTHGHVHAAHEVLIQGLRLSHTPLAWRETALDWLAHSGDARTAWMLSQHDAPHPVRAHPHYLALEAALAQATGHWQASRRLYGRMVALSPTDAMAWAGLGIALDQLDQTSGALRADRKALALGTLSRPLAGYLNQRIHALDQVISTREPSHHP